MYAGTLTVFVKVSQKYSCYFLLLFIFISFALAVSAHFIAAKNFIFINRFFFQILLYIFYIEAWFTFVSGITETVVIVSFRHSFAVLHLRAWIFEFKWLKADVLREALMLKVTDDDKFESLKVKQSS